MYYPFFHSMLRHIIRFTVVLCALTTVVAGQRQLTLDQAVGIAMDQSPDIRSTELDLERNRELLRAQQAATKSQFRLNITPFSYQNDLSFNRFLSAWSASETKESNSRLQISQPIRWTGGTLSLIDRFGWQDSYSDYQDVRNRRFSNDLYLNFSQPIFTYNEIETEMRQLELNLERAELTYALQELQIERLVAEYFYRVYQNQLNLQVAEEELANQERSYQIIQNKVEADLVAREELYQAELNLLNSRSAVQNAHVTLQNSYDQLKALLDIPLSDSISVQADTTVSTIDASLERAIASGQRSRQELRQREIDIENARINLKQTAAQNDFRGTISLTYGLTGVDEQFSDIFNRPSNNQAVGISFEIPLWDWGEREARIGAAEATVEQQRLSYSELQIELARQTVKNAERTYDINLERYEYGDLTSMDLSLYQSQLSQRKTELISNLVDYKLALLDLKIQSLWDFRTNEPVLRER